MEKGTLNMTDKKEMYETVAEALVDADFMNDEDYDIVKVDKHGVVLVTKGIDCEEYELEEYLCDKLHWDISVEETGCVECLYMYEFTIQIR